MIVNMKQLLENAKIGGYAVPQFNINNLEWVKYILETCEKEKSPVILGVSEGAIKYMGGYNVVSGLIQSMIVDLHIKVPVALHLDHGSSIESCKQAIDAKFTSVMIDASSHFLDENIRITRQVVEYAEKYDVSVEAEIGTITDSQNISNCVNIQDAEVLYRQTNVTALAPAVGNAHGLYLEEPKLQYETIKALADKNILLVLHGASGIKDNDIRKAIQNGICKININTEIQVAWATAVKKYIMENQNIYDPRKIIASGEVAMKQLLCEKIRLFGSNEKA